MRYLFALLLPPLAVLSCGKPFQAFLNLFLTLFFWVPGVVHACLVVHTLHADRRAERIVRYLRDHRDHGETERRFAV